MPKTPDPIDAHIGEKVRIARQAAHVTQERLARALGISYQQIQKNEAGINKLTASRLYRIARYLAYDITFFYQDIDTLPPPTAPRPAPLRDQAARDLDIAFAQIKNKELRTAITDMIRAIVEAGR